jgi:hypothetical protein
MRTLALLAMLSFPSLASGAETVIQKLSVTNEPGKRTEVWLTRSRLEEGGLAVKLYTRQGAEKSQSTVVYEGGGGDEGPGDDDVTDLKLGLLPVGGGRSAVRVDLTHRALEGKKGDLEVETSILTVKGAPKLLLTLQTGRQWSRSKQCRAGETTTLAVEAGEEGRRLVATTQKTVDPELGDDDLPIDKSCVAPAGRSRRSWLMRPEGLVEEAVAPPPPSGGAGAREADRPSSSAAPAAGSSSTAGRGPGGAKGPAPADEGDDD